MKYINPYDLAFVIQFNDLDGQNLKKFKRRFFAELELFDEEIKIKNRVFSKSECVEVINEIDNNKRLLNIYFAVYYNDELNNFLYGIYNKSYLKKIKNDLAVEEKVTKDFISPYIKEILTKVYKSAFLNNEQEILSLDIPLEEKYKEEIYTSVYKILKSYENDLIELKKEYSYNLNDIKKIIDINKINILPNYFKKIIDDIAYAIRNLSIDSWNDKEDMNLALSLIDFALQLNISSKVKEKFLNDKNDLNKVKKERYSHDIILKIDNIMKDYYKSFNQKLEEILRILNSAKKDDLIARATFNIIMNYINEKDNGADELVQAIPNFKNILNKLNIISNDFEFKQVINSNLRDLETIDNKINSNNDEDDYSWVWWVVGIFIFLIIGNK